jgi:hypothetical protein
MPADVFLSLQAIMRQPALLLHDGTINPSTYDKESIAQWLAEHRCVYVEDGGGGGVADRMSDSGRSGDCGAERRSCTGMHYGSLCWTLHCCHVSIMLGGIAQWHVGHRWGLWLQSAGLQQHAPWQLVLDNALLTLFSFCHGGWHKQASLLNLVMGTVTQRHQNTAWLN